MEQVLLVAKSRRTRNDGHRQTCQEEHQRTTGACGCAALVFSSSLDVSFLPSRCVSTSTGLCYLNKKAHSEVYSKLCGSNWVSGPGQDPRSSTVSRSPVQLSSRRTSVHGSETRSPPAEGFLSLPSSASTSGSLAFALAVGLHPPSQHGSVRLLHACFSNGIADAHPDTLKSRRSVSERLVYNNASYSDHSLSGEGS